MAVVHITQYDAMGVDGAGNILPGYPSQPLAPATKVDVTALAEVVILHSDTRFLRIWGEAAIEWREGEDSLNTGNFTAQSAIVEMTVRVPPPTKDADRENISRSVSVRATVAP